jgi:hypothetical protein
LDANLEVKLRNYEEAARENKLSEEQRSQLTYQVLSGEAQEFTLITSNIVILLMLIAEPRSRKNIALVLVNVAIGFISRVLELLHKYRKLTRMHSKVSQNFMMILASMHPSALLTVGRYSKEENSGRIDCRIHLVTRFRCVC